MADQKLTVDLEENVTTHIIEQEDDFDDATLEEEEMQAIAEANTKFDKEELIPALLKTFDVCRCQMGEFMGRNMQRAQLLNINPQQYQPTVEQSDVDKFKFSTVIVTKRGIPDGISCIIKECKSCHKIEYFGRSEIFSQMIAEATVNWETYNKEATQDVESTEENPLGEDVILEDVDTVLEIDDVVGTTEELTISEE